MRSRIPTRFVFFLLCSLAMGFREKPTQTIVIKGRIKNEIKIEFADFNKYTLHTIGSVVITNHKGDAKSKAKHLKGVLLKDILQNIVLDDDNPKVFSEYYFVCTAADGYKVVFSWNELFNTAITQRVFIVLERDGKNLANDEDGILMISADDFRTGRRYVKNLETIVVNRVN